MPVRLSDPNLNSYLPCYSTLAIYTGKQSVSPSFFKSFGHNMIGRLIRDLYFTVENPIFHILYFDCKNAYFQLITKYQN